MVFHLPALSGHPPKQRAAGDGHQLQPGLAADDRATGVASASGDFDHAPGVRAAQRDGNVCAENLDPASAVFGLVATDIDPDEVGATPAPG